MKTPLRSNGCSSAAPAPQSARLDLLRGPCEWEQSPVPGGGFTHRWQRQNSRVFTRRAAAPEAAGAVPAVWEGQTFPWEGHHLQSWERGTEQGSSFSILLLMWERVSVHPRHSGSSSCPWLMQRECQRAGPSWKGSPHLHPQAQGQPNILGFPQQHRTASIFVPRGRYSNS